MASSYNLSGHEESFNCGSYDNTKTLVIDPWTWTSSPALATNKAYDVNYDNVGEVFVYGSSGTWQLAKFNSAGVKQWTYNATPISTGYYGDFSCDRFSGKCFCTEGFDASGMQSIEVSAAGAQTALTKCVANLQEGWRDAWDPCKGITVIGGGSWQTTCDAGGSVDTNDNITPVNVLNENATEEGHDMALTCVDPNGVKCYMASTQSAGDPGNFNNVMIQLPVPALTPTAYQTATGYAFQESNVAQYVGAFTANGLNGMAASANWLYIYDGANLKRVNKGTGAIVSTVAVTGTSEDWGGLDVDPCDNVYVGENSAIEVYSSTLTLTTTYATSSTIYDLQLGKNYQALYACGNGFLSYMPLTAPSVSITKTRTNASCGCTGTASASLTECATTVTTGVTYAWSNGATTSSITNLCAGTYTINITLTGCPNSVYTDTLLIKSVGGGGPALTLAQTNVLCNGGATGSGTVTATGGTSPYTYLWTPGGNTNSNATGLTAGTYTVTVTDHNGCSSTATITITQPTALTLTATNTPVKCNGGTTGTATATAGGGTTAYTYAWTGGNTNSTATGLTAGTYTITVTDHNGCTITASTTITQPPALTLTLTNTPVKCNGGATGSVTATAGGGTPAYTYAWAPGGSTSSNTTGLTAGTYTCTLTDANGCTITASTTITQPTALTLTATNTPVKCNGGATGTATATAGGGTPAYTYLWTPSAKTSSTATGLTAGSYTVTVTDANGCTITASTTITQPTALTLTLANTPVKCNGGATGTATATAGGGTPAYTYAWAPGGNTNSNATGLTAGTYTCTVTDANGCTITASTTITQPTALTLTLTNTPVKCNGAATGTVTATAGGGTPAYTYAWAPGGSTNSNTTGLTAGTYTCTLTDANGCTITASTTITQPTALTATTTTTTATCGNSNGSATVTAGGGTPGYTYLWTPTGKTTSAATGLSAGAYTVTVTDANGCTITANANVANAAAETVTITGTTNILCNGGTNGVITTNTTGGTAPYTYLWTPGGQTGSNATGLSAGTYTVTVTDHNGCVSTATATLTQPTALTLTTANTPVKCNAGTTGTATATAGGGAGGYTYVWTPGGNTNSNATGLSAGTYTITVKDANGCTITASTTITQPTALTSAISNTPVLCNGGTTGSVTETSGGGTPGYTYLWTPSGATTSNVTGLTAGAYTVTITDANGCTLTATTTITQPIALTATTTTTTSTCGKPNGSASVLAGGGAGGYTYLWTPSGSTVANNTGLTAGSYTVTVTDANGCTITASATVPNASAETVTISGTTNILCNGGTNGSFNTTTVGGTPPYTYLWTPSGQTGSNATGLSAGTYTVTVTDANGCISTASATLTQPTLLTVTTGGIVNVLCNGGTNGSASATAGGGTPAYSYSWSNGQTNSNATGLSAGTYTITVTDANGCTATATATITQPPVLTATMGVPTNVSCNAGSDGSAGVTAGGGTPGYSYLWTNGQTNSNSTGLTVGSYTVTVTDANGCTATASVTITQPTAIALTKASTTSFCGKPDGSATITAAGGTPPYTYLWSTGGTTSGITNLSPGSYCVTVTDNHGCQDTACITVPNKPGVLANITASVNILCNGGNNGSATVTATNGTPNYTYSWTNGATNSNATGLTAGGYTVTVTDSAGCIATASVTLTQPTVLTVTTGGIVNVLCNGGSNGSITGTAGGGTSPYAYLWSNGQTNSTATGLTAGSYTITVTDANGCTATASATVTQPPVLTVTTGAPVEVLCNGGSNGSDVATAGGGTTPYAYSWTNGQTNSTATGLTAGSYTITVTDADGCTATASVTVTQPTALTASTTTVSSTCGNSNGTATVTAGGGTPGYTYAWNNGQTSSTATGLLAGSYTVTITDNNGCTLTTSATVLNIPGETVTINPPVNVLCNGGNNGSATPTVVGGTTPYTYLWSNAQTSSTATGLTAGSYTLAVTDANGCIATASVTITQPPLLTVTTGAPTNVLCNGGTNGSVSCTAGGGTGIYTYAWTPGGQTGSTATSLTAGTYTITVTDANGCTATATATITQPTALTVTAAGFPVTCNAGSNGQATAIPAGGTPGYTYAWSNGTTKANDNNLTAGSYTITVTDANGCTVDTTVMVTQPAPIVVAFTADTIAGCAPLCTGFKDGTTDPGGTVTNWAWSYTDGGSDTIQDPRHCFNAPGSYGVTLTVTDNHGCTGTLTIPNMITVYSSPVAAFTMGPQPTTIDNPTISFTDKSTDAYGIAAWLWNFADPLNDVPSTQQNPSHTYGDTGTFCATLTVTNIHGCVDSITQCLIIGPAYSLYIPNAFSPNGDGKNEVFAPKGEFVTDFKMYIFDRWGMMLYYTEDINKGWPGTVNGGTRICQEDSYVYLIQATDNLGQIHKYIGKVTLLK